MVTRRDVLKVLMLGIIGWGLGARSAAESPTEKETPIEFSWRVPEAHLEAVRNNLSFAGEVSEEKGGKAFGLVFVFIGSVFLTHLAKAVLALRQDMVHGGIVIDTRGAKIDIYTDKSLPGGMIMLVTSEGTRLYEREEIGDSEELLSALRKGT